MTRQKLAPPERKSLIQQISKASGIAQYALEAKTTDEQILEAAQNLEVLSLIKSANNYNRYCQGQKTAEANKRLKEFVNIKNSEIYKAGQWLFQTLSTSGKARADSLLEKDLVHKEDRNQAVKDLTDTVQAQQLVGQQQYDTAQSTIESLQNRIDSLQRQMGAAQQYIENDRGPQYWKRVKRYMQGQV